MNCVKDDLAIIVGSNAGNNGKIVRCVRLATANELDFNSFRNTDGPVWIIDRLIKSTGGSIVNLCRDRSLRPIRDQPGNEQFVTEARKSLPRKKPVTGPVTIDSRGEVKA